MKAYSGVLESVGTTEGYMISIAALFLWVASGSLLSMKMIQPGESRCAWVPMAILLGPFWAAIAAEQGTGLSLRAAGDSSVAETT